MLLFFKNVIIALMLQRLSVIEFGKVIRYFVFFVKNGQPNSTLGLLIAFGSSIYFADNGPGKPIYCRTQET